MSDIIQLLPDAVANQIAAGEVVQRPASVVKELLENAIDAGADSMQLIVKDSGRTLIQVIDNGAGMTETDARLSIERHATSKIKTASDLFAVRSMGFRGEALASIAAISHMEIKTRREEDELGTRILVEGSEVKEQKPVQTAKGTSISVKNLFFNVPARRNFLKSNQVEMRHIIEEFNRVALANPQISLEMFDNGQPKFQLPASNLKQRIVNLFGKNMDKKLVPVETQTSLLNIYGYTGKPEFAKKTRGEQYFFVNNRFFKHAYLNHAVENAYDQLLPDKNYASYFIFFEIDPQKIDINIHPTKTEINFEDGQSTYAILRSAIKKAIGKHNLTPSLDFENEQDMFPGNPSDKERIKQPDIKVTPGYNPFESSGNTAPAGPQQSRQQQKNNLQNWEKLYQQPDSEQREFKKENIISSDTEEGQDNHDLIHLHQEYIVSSIKSGLMLIHQQRAHERVLYEHFLARLQKEDGNGQKLMFPETVTLAPADSELLEEIQKELKSMGFDMQHKEQNEWEFNATPAGMEGDLQSIIESMLEDYKSQMMNASTDRHSNIARALAKRTAIKKGRRLEKPEMQALIDSLFACAMPEVSVEGKPIIRIITNDELNHKFNE
ncbi:MAG: DNA mismatch repair endonuclease MutL [Bacteroidota bacterium]